MKMDTEIAAIMLAPCGMNCQVCYVHLKKKPCPGCRGAADAKPEHCRKCQIKDCALRQGLDFCFSCSAFPCTILKRLDKSYQKRYRVSLIGNAKRLKIVGIQQFWLEESEKWTCAVCGGVISLHDGVCSECGLPRVSTP
jgi:hypothetical protein